MLRTTIYENMGESLSIYVKASGQRQSTLKQGWRSLISSVYSWGIISFFHIFLSGENIFQLSHAHGYDLLRISFYTCRFIQTKKYVDPSRIAVWGWVSTL